jgi:tetratricopeptide (TPR) repeat protein
MVEEQICRRRGLVSERMAALAYVYARAGHRAEAHALWTGYLKHSGRAYVTWYQVAIFYAGMGDRERAFACLDKALAEHDSRLRDVKQEPYLSACAQIPASLGWCRVWDFELGCGSSCRTLPSKHSCNSSRLRGTINEKNFECFTGRRARQG